MDSRFARLGLLAGVLIAAFGALGLATTDGPRLSLDSLDPWVVVYALGVLVTLGSVPFLLRDRHVARFPDRDEHWEPALTAWGGVSLVAALVFVLIGLAFGFESSSASGAIAIVGLAACGLVLAGLALLVISS